MTMCLNIELAPCRSVQKTRLCCVLEQVTIAFWTKRQSCQLGVWPGLIWLHGTAVTLTWLDSTAGSGFKAPTADWIKPLTRRRQRSSRRCRDWGRPSPRLFHLCIYSYPFSFRLPVTKVKMSARMKTIYEMEKPNIIISKRLCVATDTSTIG